MTGPMPQRLLLDISKTFQTEFATGIQRVTRELVRRRERLARRLGLTVAVVVAADGRYFLLNDEEIDRLLAPVSRSKLVLEQSSLSRLLKRMLSLNLDLYTFVQRHAVEREMTQRTRQLDQVAVTSGDIVAVADAIGAGSTSIAALDQNASRAHGSVALIYDIIGLLHPDLVPATTIHPFRRALARMVRRVDGLITIARATADEIRHHPLVSAQDLPVESFYLGYDPAVGGVPSRPTIPDSVWSSAPTFLMVGTIEPRKRHAAVLDAFDLLWSRGRRANLVLIGSIGWDVDDVLRRVHAHPELGRSLFLCHQVGDDELREAIRRADATIMASRAEGFGLPLVESLALGTPVLASDITVFREIAGEAGVYFPPDDACEMAAAIERFILQPDPIAAAAQRFQWIDWDGAADQLADAIVAILTSAGKWPRGAEPHRTGAAVPSPGVRKDSE